MIIDHILTVRDKDHMTKEYSAALRALARPRLQGRYWRPTEQ